MKMISNADIFEIYSKSTSISDIKKSLWLTEEAVKLENSSKTDTNILFTHDVSKIPTMFQLAMNFSVEFNLKTIKSNFVKDSTENMLSPFSSNNDDSIDKLIKQSMKKVPTQEKKPVKVDFTEVYKQVFEVLLSSDSVKLKIKKLIKAGVITVGDFDIVDVSYGKSIDLSTYFKQFITQYKSNPNAPIKIPFGYIFTLVSNNNQRAYTKKECIDASKLILQQIEKSILAKDMYFDFVKK